MERRTIVGIGHLRLCMVRRGALSIVIWRDLVRLAARGEWGAFAGEPSRREGALLMIVILGVAGWLVMRRAALLLGYRTEVLVGNIRGKRRRRVELRVCRRGGIVMLIRAPTLKLAETVKRRVPRLLMDLR